MLPYMPVKVPKRLTRPPSDHVPAFQCTDRDEDLLRLVSAYRFADSDQLYRFLRITNPTTSQQKIRRRLQAMFAHGLLNRPKNQHVQIGTLAPLVYSIGSGGLKRLSASTAPVDARAVWAAKASRTASPLFLDHALGVTECMLTVTKACADKPGALLIDQPELVATFPNETQNLKHPLRLRVTVFQDSKPLSTSIIPDRLFGIAYRDGRRVFALEWDTGSMTIATNNLSKSSIGKKQLCYLAAYDAEKFLSQWQCKQLRVLFVTTSHDRIDAMLKTQQEISNGRLSGMFCYATQRDLLEHGPFAPIWRSATENNIKLLPEH